MILIRPATHADALYVAENLRADDFAELRVIHMGTSVPQAVVNGAISSKDCFAVFPVRAGRLHSKPVALFGVTDDPNYQGYGAVWFLATEDAASCSLSIVKEAPRWLSFLSRSYPNGLHNCADKRNRLHIRWCKSTGFNIGPTVDVRGFPFIYISRPRTL